MYENYYSYTMPANVYFKQSEAMHAWAQEHCDMHKPEFMTIPYGDETITSIEVLIAKEEDALLFVLTFQLQ